MNIPRVFELVETQVEVDRGGDDGPPFHGLRPLPEVVALHVPVVRRFLQAKPPQLSATPLAESRDGFNGWGFKPDIRMGRKGPTPRRGVEP